MKNLFITLLLLVSLQVYATEGILETIKQDDLKAYLRASNNEYNIHHLNQSIKLGAVSIFEFLVKEIEDINTFDSLGNTPMLQAAMANNGNFAQSLLAAKANPNLAAKSGLQATPLMYAAASNNTEMIQQLLNNEAKINQVDVNRDHALNWATYYGHLQAMEMLMKNGADVTLRSKHGQAVDVGFRLWHADSVTAVFVKYMELGSLSVKAKKLMNAVKANDLTAAAKHLKKMKANELVDQLGSPMINLAIEKGNVDMVKRFQQAGADVNQLNRVGQAPLAIAARFGHEKIVKVLLQAGADANLAGGHYRLTPLIASAVSGNPVIGQMFLNAGADIDKTDSINGGAALHWAIFYGNTAFAEMLIEQKADYKAKVLAGEYDARSLAKVYQNEAVLKAIEQTELKNNPLFGSWMMSEIHYIYTDTTYKVKLAYPGRLMVGSSTYSIMYNPYGNARETAQNISKLSEEEMVYAFKTLAFNTGTYTIADGVFTTTADIAKVAGFEGGVQRYAFNTHRDDLELTMFDETYPDGKKPEWYGKLKILFKLKRE